MQQAENNGGRQPESLPVRQHGSFPERRHPQRLLRRGSDRFDKRRGQKEEETARRYDFRRGSVIFIFSFWAIPYISGTNGLLSKLTPGVGVVYKELMCIFTGMLNISRMENRPMILIGG